MAGRVVAVLDACEETNARGVGSAGSRSIQIGRDAKSPIESGKGESIAVLAVEEAMDWSLGGSFDQEAAGDL